MNLNIIKLVDSFLSDRTFQIRVGSHLSNKFNIKAGIPQGAVLSPILYNLYTADVPNNLLNTNICTFADDTAILSHSRNLNLSAVYLKIWKIKINPSKCQLINLSHKNANPSREIKLSEVIPWKNSIKYLGIRFDRRLTRSCHIQYTIDKVENRTNQLYPIFGRKSCLDINNKRLLYLACVRPIILYDSVVWGQTVSSHLRVLERSQNSFSVHF